MPSPQPIRDVAPTPEGDTPHVRHAAKRTNARSLAGKRYGRLTVREESDRRAANGCILWVCDCRCGTANVLVATHNLTSGNTTSCGCEQRRRTQQHYAARRKT